MAMATMAVTTLKNTCAAASRRAFDVAPMAARMPVSVVPTLAPITMAAPTCTDIMPPATAVSTSVSVAEEACSTMVSSRPTPTAMARPGRSLPSAGRAVVVPEKPFLRMSMPRNITPKPASAVPRPPRRVPSPVSLSAMPTPTNGRAKASIFILKPIQATSQPVTEEPRLEPNTTHSAEENVSNPALTKPIAATVMAVDDCSSAVSSTPVISPCRRVRVQAARMRSSARPAAIFRPSVSMVMPTRNRPTPPSSVMAMAVAVGAADMVSALPHRARCAHRACGPPAGRHGEMRAGCARPGLARCRARPWPHRRAPGPVPGP